MKNIVVDYETFYDKKAGVSTTDQGNRNYVRDSYAYCIAICDDNEAWCGTLEEARERYTESFWTDSGVQFWAANSNFDQGWNERYFPQTARPWKCVLDLGVFQQFPRNLAGLAKVALGTKVDKGVRDKMDGVHFRDLPETEQTEVLQYCLNDTLVERELLVSLPAMSPLEDGIAAHTRMINRRGVHLNLDLIEADKEKIARMRHTAFCKIPWHNVSKPLSHEALSQWCKNQGFEAPQSLAKDDEDCSFAMSQNPVLEEVINWMRRFRKSNTMLKKCEEALNRVTDDGVMPLDILYCGAPHTRRWSSRGFNVQNLDKLPVITSGDISAKQLSELWDNGEKTPDGVEYVWTRNWIVPPPGKTFLILDYSQVEPRALNWMVRNEEMLAGIRAGFNVYEAYAISIRRWSGKPGQMKKDIGLAAYTKTKNEVLGLGYGMGASRYIGYAGVDAAEAKATVQGFRSRNPKITAFWGRLDTLIKSAARDKQKILQLQMPTGDMLKHFDVCAFSKRGADGKPKSGFRSTTVRGDYSQNTIQDKLWGGTLCENVIQRMARDIMAEAILKLEAAGFPVMFHSHDEIILAVDTLGKEAAKAEAVNLMCKPPEWCPDLPLAVEGDFAECYTK